MGLCEECYGCPDGISSTGCKILLSSLCVSYDNSSPLSYLGINSGDKLEVILQKIDDALLGLSNSISGINLTNSTSSVYVEQFVGTTDTFVNLQNAPNIEVLNVFLEGLALPNNVWGFTPPTTVNINFAALGITREVDDVIRVEYKK